MLASSIGFLFVTQMMTACQNITTLESFTEGIYEKVIISLLRTLLLGHLEYKIFDKFLEARLGFYQQTLSLQIVH